MRALTSAGLFAEDDNRCFALTPLGAALCSDVPGSLRSFAIEVLGRNRYAAWEKLGYSIKTGAIAFNHVYGASKWQYNAEHPEEARIFAEAMASFNTVTADAIVASYDFSFAGTIVDLGTGVRRNGIRHRDCVEAVVLYIQQHELKSVVLGGP